MPNDPKSVPGATQEAQALDLAPIKEMLARTVAAGGPAPTVVVLGHDLAPFTAQFFRELKLCVMVDPWAPLGFVGLYTLANLAKAMSIGRDDLGMAEQAPYTEAPLLAGFNQTMAATAASVRRDQAVAMFGAACPEPDWRVELKAAVADREKALAAVDAVDRELSHAELQVLLADMGRANDRVLEAAMHVAPLLSP